MLKNYDLEGFIYDMFKYPDKIGVYDVINGEQNYECAKIR